MPPLQILSRSTLLTAINDSRARPHFDMSTQPPACRWACRGCNILGVKDSILQSTVYAGAARYLDDSRPHKRLLREWKARFRGTPTIIENALNRPIVKRDLAFRREAGKAADEARRLYGDAGVRSVRQATGYLGTDVFTKIGLDVTRINLEDPMHMVANNVQHVFNLIFNVGDQVFTEKRRKCELQRDRFPELAAIEDGYVMCLSEL